MARINQTKQVAVSIENADKLAKLSDDLGLSITKIVDLLLTQDLEQLDSGSRKFTMEVRRGDDGKPETKLI